MYLYVWIQVEIWTCASGCAKPYCKPWEDPKFATLPLNHPSPKPEVFDRTTRRKLEARSDRTGKLHVMRKLAYGFRSLDPESLKPEIPYTPKTLKPSTTNPYSIQS